MPDTASRTASVNVSWDKRSEVCKRDRRLCKYSDGPSMGSDSSELLRQRTNQYKFTSTPLTNGHTTHGVLSSNPPSDTFFHSTQHTDICHSEELSQPPEHDRSGDTSVRPKLTHTAKPDAHWKGSHSLTTYLFATQIVLLCPFEGNQKSFRSPARGHQQIGVEICANTHSGAAHRRSSFGLRSIALFGTLVRSRLCPTASRHVASQLVLGQNNMNDRPLLNARDNKLFWIPLTSAENMYVCNFK